MALDAFDMSNDVAESGRDEDLLDAAYVVLILFYFQIFLILTNLFLNSVGICW